MNTPYLTQLLKIVVATLLGALIGLERQFAVRKKISGEIDKGYVGIRTFSFYALLGAISGYLGEFYGAGVVMVSFAGMVVLIGGYYYFTATKIGDRGITTEIGGLLTFWIGVIVMEKSVLLGVTIAVIAMFLFSIKPRTEKITRKITEDELFAIMEFVLVTFVILPILPNKGYGPYNFFNPYEIWLFVVLILGVSFAGYIAIRIIGPGKGIGVTSLLGGLASSTAVTLGFSRRSASDPSLSHVYSMGIVFASSIMFFRIIVIIWVINKNLALASLIPLSVAGLSGILYAIYMFYKFGAHTHQEEVKLSNPFRLSQGIYIGILYAFIIYLVEWAKHKWGGAGVTWISFLSGLPDVDPIILSLSKLGGSNIPLSLAARGVVLASIANSLVKMILAIILGSKKNALYSSIGFLIMMIFALLGMLLFIPG